MRKLRTVTAEHLHDIMLAECQLTTVIRLLRKSGATNAARRVAACRKSVQGAVRHAERIHRREEFTHA